MARLKTSLSVSGNILAFLMVYKLTSIKKFEVWDLQIKPIRYPICYDLLNEMNKSILCYLSRHLYSTHLTEICTLLGVLIYDNTSLLSMSLLRAWQANGNSTPCGKTNNHQSCRALSATVCLFSKRTSSVLLLVTQQSQLASCCRQINFIKL